MPRLARLDAPGVLHHVIIRGIERKEIFWESLKKTDFSATDTHGRTRTSFQQPSAGKEKNSPPASLETQRTRRVCLLNF